MSKYQMKQFRAIKGGTQDEVMGKARMILSSLDMNELYLATRKHGELVDFAYNNSRCVATFKDNSQMSFRRL